MFREFLPLDPIAKSRRWSPWASARRWAAPPQRLAMWMRSGELSDMVSCMASVVRDSTWFLCQTTPWVSMRCKSLCHCNSTRLWTFYRHEWWASVSRLYSKYHKHPEHSRIIHLGPLWIPWCMACMGWGCINLSWIRTLEFISPIRGHFCLRRTLSLGECHDPKSACLTFWSRFVVAVIPAIPERHTENLVILKPFWMLLSPEIMEHEWKWMNMLKLNRIIASNPLADKRPAASGQARTRPFLSLRSRVPHLDAAPAWVAPVASKTWSRFRSVFGGCRLDAFSIPMFHYMRQSLAKHSLSGLFLDYSWSVVWL